MGIDPSAPENWSQTAGVKQKLRNDELSFFPRINDRSVSLKGVLARRL